MKIKYWLDSGANVHSCRKATTTLGELGYTLAEWQAMTQDQKDEVVRELAFERSDWGYTEES